MSVEGMWAVYFGDVGGQQVNSGIAVLETGRIFGGEGKIDLAAGQIDGHLWELRNPAAKISAQMKKVAQLPG